MVTSVNAETIPWYYFLEQAEAGEDGKDGLLRKGVVQSWRQGQWPMLKSALMDSLPDWDSEREDPHWVDFGIAIMWRRQERIQRLGVSAETPAGEDRQDEVSRLWQPSHPLGLHTVGNILHHLENGYRFRPPQGEHVELEAAPPANAPSPPRRIYRCTSPRHRRGPAEFTNWRTYIQCCLNCGVVPTEPPPVDVANQALQYEYFCPIHMAGFHTEDQARKHLMFAKGPHVTNVNQMKLKRPQMAGKRLLDPPKKDKETGPRVCGNCGNRKSKKAKVCRPCHIERLNKEKNDGQATEEGRNDGEATPPSQD